MRTIDMGDNGVERFWCLSQLEYKSNLLFIDDDDSVDLGKVGGAEMGGEARGTIIYVLMQGGRDVSTVGEMVRYIVRAG